MAIKLSEIESEMKEIIKDMMKILNLEGSVDADICPGELIKSDALITIPGRLNAKLGISIPLDCYPFADDNRKQLSIRDASKKVFTLVKDGK